MPHGVLNAVIVSDDNSQYGAGSSILQGTQSSTSHGLLPRRDFALIELRAVFAHNIFLPFIFRCFEALTFHLLFFWS